MSQPATAESPLLVATTLQGRISGLLGKLTLHRAYHNPHRIPLELTHIFPLPPQAAVIALRLKTAKRYLPGKLQARRQARQLFQTRADLGKTACTLEQERPDLVTLRVGPLAPGGSLEVEIGLEVILAQEKEHTVFSFPLTAGRLYIPGHPSPGPPVGMGTSFDTDLVADASRLNPPRLGSGESQSCRSDFHLDLTVESAGRAICHTHPLEISPQRGALRIQTAPQQQPARDLVLRLNRSANRPLLVEPASASFHFTPRWRGDERQKRPLVIVLDRSYAMKGAPLKCALAMAQSLVDSLDSEQLFGVVSFAASPLHFRSHLVPAIAELKAAARAYLQELSALPGVELLQALTAAEVLLEDQNGPCDLVLLSSGQLGDQDRLVFWASAQDSLSLHCLALGAVVNAGLLERLSGQTGGSYHRLEHPDRLEPCREALLEVLSAARLSDLCLVGEPLLSASPPQWELSSGWPGSFHGRFVRTPRGPLEMVATLPDGGEYSVPVEPQKTSHPSLKSCGTRARLLDLEAQWTSLSVGTVDLAVEGDRQLDEAASRLRQEAERGKAWLERVQEFWRRKGWLFPGTDSGQNALPLVKAMDDSSCMAYGLSRDLQSLEDEARQLLHHEAAIEKLSLESEVLCRFTAFVACSGTRVPGTNHRLTVPVPPVG